MVMYNRFNFVKDGTLGRSPLMKRIAYLCAIVSSTCYINAAIAQLPAPPREISIDENGVDIRTGNITLKQEILNIGPANNLGLHFTRSVNSGGTRDSFDSTYYEVRSGTEFWSIDASFGDIGDAFGTYGTDVGANYDAGIGEGPRYQHSSGIIVTFGRLILDQNTGDNSSSVYRLATKVTYPDGTILSIHYKVIDGVIPRFRIQSITNNAGYQIKFRYANNSSGSGWDQRIAAIGINNTVEYCDPSADECSLVNSWPTATFALDSNSYRITNPAGETTTYKSTNKTSSSPATYSITKPGSTIPSVTYETVYLASSCIYAVSNGYCSLGSDSRVTKASTPFRSTSYTYNYKDGNFTEITSSFFDQSTPQNIINKYTSFGSSAPGIRSWTDPLLNVYTYEYNAKGIITKATWPLKNRYEWKRDLNGNPTLQTIFAKDGLASIKASQTYGACQMGVLTCNKPVTLTDPNGVVTNIRYNSHGQKISELGGADGRGFRSLIRWEYTDRYVSIKNSSGGMTQYSTPVSVLSKTIVCRTASNNDISDPKCKDSADEFVTTYEFGSNKHPLLPVGEYTSDGNSTRRSCYVYDNYGRRISETKPLANLPKCPAD